MGLFDSLFGFKKQPHAETNRTPSPSRSQELVSYSGNFMNIDSLSFFGPFKKSKSGDWIIAWSDSDEEHSRGGHRKSGYGRYILYNATEKRITLQGRLQRPNSGKVANSGYFCIEDWHFGSDLSGTFSVFSPAGTELIKKRFKANILNSDISDSGRFAICQTANNPNSTDGNLLVAFDVEKNIMLFSVHPPTGWANSYEFIEDNAHFVVVIDKIGKFRYDAQGNFIDAAEYDSARLNCDRFDIMLLAAEDLLKNPKLDRQQAETALSAVLRSRSIGADKDQGWKALALKLQGLAHEVLGNSSEALLAFEDALKINPKIGVKRKADALRENRLKDKS